MSLDDNEREKTATPAERLKKMRAISQRTARLLREGGPPVDHGDLIYDERGLPKQTGAVSKPNLDEMWPVHPTAVWPEELSLRREDMYEDRV